MDYMVKFNNLTKYTTKNQLYYYNIMNSSTKYSTRWPCVIRNKYFVQIIMYVEDTLKGL